MNPRDDDPVKDFFDSHRGRVVDHGADEETWEVIRSEARRGQHPRGLWFLGGAAAAAAAAVAGVLVFQGLSTPTTEPITPAGSVQSTPDRGVGEPDQHTAAPTSGTAATDGSTASASAEPTQTTSTDGGQAAPTGPPTFTLPAADPSTTDSAVVQEPTGQESDLRTAVYHRRCAQEELGWSCPGLAVSEDQGSTWTAQVDMFAAGYYGALSSRGSTWLWAAGGERPDAPKVQTGLVRSDDAGRTWVDIPTRGAGVLYVETFRSTLVVVTQGCAGTTSADCVEVVITDVTTDDATTGRRLITIDDLPELVNPMTPAGPLPGGLIQATYDAVYLSMSDRGVTYRIADGEQIATQVDAPCEDFWTAPDTPDTVLSTCDGTIRRSTDGGQRWQEIAAPEGAATLQAASDDGHRILALTSDGVQRSGDAGKTWTRTLDLRDEAVPDGLDPARIELLRADGGGSFRVGTSERSAMGEDGPAAVRWTSTDSGESWQLAPPILPTTP